MDKETNKILKILLIILCIVFAIPLVIIFITFFIFGAGFIGLISWLAGMGLGI